MDQIVTLLSDLEKKHDITIIYSIDAGSRAWGLDNKDSDYDIRFVYIHNGLKSYLSLDPPDTTIDGFSEDRVFDWQGWELSKALLHLRDTNPTLVEWIYSPIVYRSGPLNFPLLARGKLEGNKRTGALLQHYFSMAKKNFLSNVQGKELVSAKKYLCAVRPAAMLLWILNCGQTSERLIEIDATKLFNDIRPYISDEIFRAIKDLQERKQNDVGAVEQSRVKIIDDWIGTLISTETFEGIKEHLKHQPGKLSIQEFDEILFTYLKHSLTDQNL